MAITASTLAILQVGKLNLALPALAHSIGAGPTAQQLVLSAYALGFGLALVPCGRLGDAWSRRRMLLLGLGWLGATGLAASVAGDPALLVAVRLLQGIGAGMLLPQTTGLMQDLYEGPDLARAYGSFGAVVGVSSMVAPPLGGLFLWAFGDDLGWRLNFLVDLPVVAVLMIVGVRVLPENSVRAPTRSLDPVGLVLLGTGVLALMLPFVGVLGGPPWSPLGCVCAALGVGSGAAFLRWERRFEQAGGAPVVSPRLWRLPSFRGGVLVGVFFFLAVSGSALVAGLYLQEHAGLSALEVALLWVSASFASSFSAWHGGRVPAARGRVLVTVGLVTVGVGAAATAVVCVAAAARPSLVLLLVPVQALTGAGAGLVTAPNQALAMVDVPRVDGSVAGSVFQVGQRMGTAVGTTVALHVYAAGPAGAGLLGATALVLAFTAAAVAASLGR